MLRPAGLSLEGDFFDVVFVWTPDELVDKILIRKMA